jgi:hypothetical protein
MDGRVVIRVHRDWRLDPYDVSGSDGELIGSFVAVPDISRSGQERPGFWTWPWDAVGSVRIEGEDVADVECGNMIDPHTRRQLAAVSPYQGRDISVLRLRIADGIEGPLRLMALGWLGVAHDLIRATAIRTVLGTPKPI